MSHFSVLVITEQAPLQEDLERILLPWHEFECTGLDNEYVVEVDRNLNELNSDWEKHNNGKSFHDFLLDWCGITFIADGEQPQIETIHKHGYGVLDKDGDIVRIVQRTNPNAKWDWWQIGGRYAGKLRTLTRNKTDSCRRAELSWVAMKWARQMDRAGWITEILAGSELSRDNLQTALQLAPTAHTAWLALDPRPRGEEYAKWLVSTYGVPGFHLVKARNAAPFDLPDLDPTQTIDEWIAAAPALSCFAVVKDGKWYEQGNMGWWGIVVDEKDKGVWEREFNNLIEDLAPESWLTVVDCHI